jgi:transposase
VCPTGFWIPGPEAQYLRFEVTSSDATQGLDAAGLFGNLDGNGDVLDFGMVWDGTRSTGPKEIDRDLAEHVKRIRAGVTTSGTTITDLFGVGPVVAAYLIGHTGDIARFPTAGHYARYNGTAPIEASSGTTKRHRLNPRGNRQLNHALHMAAVTQVRNDTPGRAYYPRKQADGHHPKEAMRALKRRISDAVYRQLLTDSQR